MIVEYLLTEYPYVMFGLFILIALIVGRLLTSLLPMPTKNRGFLAQLPLIGAFLAKRKEPEASSGRDIFLYEIAHLFFWALAYRYLGWKFYTLLALILISILILSFFHLILKNHLPVIFVSLVPVIAALFLFLSVDLPNPYVRLMPIDRYSGLVMVVFITPILYFNNKRKVDDHLLKVIMMMVGFSLIFGWLLMFLTIAMTLVIDLFIQVILALTRKTNASNRFRLIEVMIFVLAINLIFGFDWIEAYLNILKI